MNMKKNVLVALLAAMMVPAFAPTAAAADECGSATTLARGDPGLAAITLQPGESKEYRLTPEEFDVLRLWSDDTGISFVVKSDALCATNQNAVIGAGSPTPDPTVPVYDFPTADGSATFVVIVQYPDDGQSVLPDVTFSMKYGA